MKLLLALALSSFALSSCVQFVGPDGTKVTSLGGRGNFKTKGIAGNWDHRQSFRDGAVAVAAVATSGFSYLGDKAAEGTAQVINNNSTKAGINASNNATKEVLGAQKVDVTKSTTLNPNLP